MISYARMKDDSEASTPEINVTNSPHVSASKLIMTKYGRVGKEEGQPTRLWTSGAT